MRLAAAPPASNSSSRKFAGSGRPLPMSRTLTGCGLLSLAFCNAVLSASGEEPGTVRSIEATANTPDSWLAQNIYQIITDRFFDGDPSNNNADGNYDPAGHRGTSIH